MYFFFFRLTMFYAHFVLSKKGPLARIWLAAHWDKKLTRAHVFETNISSSVEAILEPKLKMALRTSGHLLLGVVRIYSRKAKYLLADCNEAFVKIKMAFRPGVVDLPDEANREAAIAAITLPENIHDFEATIADLNEINMNTISINQSRPEDITMREDFGEINLGRQDDDFGDSAFDEVSSREIIRDADKTFGDSIYRGSDHLSMHHDADFTLNPDHDLDATLIDVKRGGRLSDGEKQIKSIDSVAHHDDIGIGDNEFDDDFLAEPDDDDENFGGRIVHSLFTDGIFEDPSAQKQLENLTSEIESHMVTGGRFDLHHDDATTTPIPTSVSEELLTSDASASRIGLGVTTMTESTTLIGNESEAFALPPIDTTSATGIEPKRATKRKRRLIVDEQKSIPSEVMKSQMENTADITTQLDLAPPTKKLMHWKETGSVDKLFVLPGRTIPSRVLQRLFMRNLYTQAVPDDASDSFQTSNLLSGLSFASTGQQQQQPLSDQSNISMSSEPAHPNISFDQSVQQHQSGNLSISEVSGVKDTMQAPQKLGAISEIPEDESAPFASHEQSRITPATPHGLNNNQDDLDDEPPIHDDLAFMVEPETPYLAPPSILSEAPPSVDMLALERELIAADNEVDNELHQAFKGDGLLSGGFPGSEAPLSVEGLPFETMEERRLEKRSKVLLRMLRVHQQQYGWDEPLTLQGLCHGNTKKQAASKFYTVLLLRKQGAVELAQEAAYADIYISRGPNFFRLVET
ncbi:Double-strand-break repair protein rad21 like [Schistosoma japonicum]|nr:Double-strand-break repair protein rad21 like [Schistosoma japonicum]